MILLIEWLGKASAWLDAAGLVRLVLAYLLTMIVIGVLSIGIFFFPIAPIGWMLGVEFSNLGPIATFSWGVLVNVFVVTPFFFIQMAGKVVRRK